MSPASPPRKAATRTRRSTAGERVAKPVVKWAGGKSKLLGKILPLIPERVLTYREPFCGGAAVFFALPVEQRKKAVLCDQNADLIALYVAIRDDVDAVIKALSRFRYDRDLFYQVRAQDATKLSAVERAARLVFLNKTCFNGLWRVNASGMFNVPFGRYDNPTILDEVALRNAAEVLRRARIVHGDFLQATRTAKQGDFVYFDPPYVPLSKTAQFTAYASEGFGHEDQLRLRDELKRLSKLGVRAVLSNHDTEETRELYRDFRVEGVDVIRSINANIKRRGAAREILVMNWGD